MYDRYQEIVKLVTDGSIFPKSKEPAIEISNISGLTITIKGPGFLLNYHESAACKFKEPIVPVQSKDVSSVGNTRFSMKVRPLDAPPKPGTQQAKSVKNNQLVEWQITVEFTKESRLSQDKKHAFIANVMKLV